MNTKLALATAALAAVVVYAAALWFIRVNGCPVGAALAGPNRPGISLENFGKIQEGMPREQVEAILAGPPRWDISGELPEEAALYCVGSGLRAAEWWGRRGVITVHYDKDGLVSKKSFADLPFKVEPPGLWDYLAFRAQ